MMKLSDLLYVALREMPVEGEGCGSLIDVFVDRRSQTESADQTM